VQLLIRDSSRKGVAFVSVDEKDRDPVGTCFFVDVPWGERDDLTYAVTARHVVDGCSMVYLDAIDKDGKGRRIRTNGSDWILSNKTDLACYRIELKKYKLKTVHIVRFLREQEYFPEGEQRLQCGMDVYMVGLFVKSAFRQAASGLETSPIVRFGKISLEETEASVYLRLADVGKPDKAKSIHAMLVECTSFEGESGSPVFSYLQYTKDLTDATITDDFYKNHPHLPRPVSLTDGDIYTPLIGMVSSHWKIESKVKSTGRRKTIGDVGLNSGIAVVVPSDDIKDFLMNDSKVEKDRKKLPKRSLNEPASPLSPRDEPEQPSFNEGRF
jgi:hypothetical protein